MGKGLDPQAVANALPEGITKFFKAINGNWYKGKVFQYNNSPDLIQTMGDPIDLLIDESKLNGETVFTKQRDWEDGELCLFKDFDSDAWEIGRKSLKDKNGIYCQNEETGQKQYQFKCFRYIIPYKENEDKLGRITE